MTLSAPIFQLKRRAKALSRNQGMPLHAALDRIAKQEGFASWSLLAARASNTRASADFLALLNPGDLALLAARPAQGKTMLGLELLADAVKAGRRGVFFTLEYHQAEALERFQSVGGSPGAVNDSFQIDASDAISADHVMERLKSAPRGTVAVIDYLQIMDQRRSNPPLDRQVAALREFAQRMGVILVFIAQIDRSYTLSEKPFPGLADIRLPNPLDLTLFDAACFMNDGKARIDRLG